MALQALSEFQVSRLSKQSASLALGPAASFSIVIAPPTWVAFQRICGHRDCLVAPITGTRPLTLSSTPTSTHFSLKQTPTTTSDRRPSPEHNDLTGRCKSESKVRLSAMQAWINDSNPSPSANMKYFNSLRGDNREPPPWSLSGQLTFSLCKLCSKFRGGGRKRPVNTVLTRGFPRSQ
jgi:hypothetical protein